MSKRTTLANPFEDDQQVSKSVQRRVAVQTAPRLVKKIAQPKGDTAICALCDTPGAGSEYLGAMFHMTCKLEMKRADGVK